MEFAVYPSLKGKAVFVTGGASGIGADIVRAFARQGSRVGFVDLDAGRGETLARDLGGAVHFEPCALRAIAARRRHPWDAVTPEYYDERIAANLRHMFFAIQAVAPDMVAAGRGSIVNMGSNSWWEVGGGMPVYTTAKAAVHGMTRSFARDLGPYRIRVNTVVPG